MAQPKIFVSHSHDDNNFAEKLVKDLNAAGSNAWLDKNELGAGDFQARINRALATCEWFVLVLSRNAVASPWVQQEVNAANARKHQRQLSNLIFIQAGPIRHDEVPPLWGVYNIYDATVDYQHALNHVLKDVGLQSSPPRSVRPPDPPSLPPATFPEALIGMRRLEVLGDRYEMEELIGWGAMATIYRGVDLRMGRVVAAKILHEVYSTDPKFVTRFRRETDAASALQHPNIVQVFDYGQSGDNYYIIMEYVDGSDLRRYLKKNGILSNERVIEIADDVALGLGAAHKLGIVHGGVNPQNIMLYDNGPVKLTDFGTASIYNDEGDARLARKFKGAEGVPLTTISLGTVQYYAPEQVQGEIVSPATDVYALGTVMYEMLTGRTPFDGDTPVTVAMRHIQELPLNPSGHAAHSGTSLESEWL